MPALPLPAATIFNAIPFGLLFVENGSIHYANTQSQTVLRRPYLEQISITELIPDYHNQLRHTVFVENIPILAHKLPLSASTQAVVVRYAIFDLPLVFERFINDRLTNIARIFEQLELVDQAELNQKQAKIVQVIEGNALVLERLHYPLRAWQHVLQQNQTTQLIRLESWLPQQLKAWQARAQSQHISFEVVYDSTSSFTIIEAALDTIINQLLMNAFQQTVSDGTIKLQISVESGNLRIMVWDSGPHPSNEYMLCWHNRLSIQMVGAWANLLQAEFFYVAEDPLGNTMTINIPLPLSLTTQRNFATLEDLLKHIPLSLELLDAQDNAVWHNSAASYYNQQPKPSYIWVEEAIPISQPMYFGTLLKMGTQTIEKLGASNLKLNTADLTYILQGLFGSIDSIDSRHILTRTTPIRGFSDLIRLGHIGPLSQELSKIFAEISQRGRSLSQASHYFSLFMYAIYHDSFYNPHTSDKLTEEFANLLSSNILNRFCTPRNITFQLNFPTFPPNKLINLYLHSIFRPVLENAIQAAPSGTVVTLQAREFENGLLFHIQDQGAGIPQAEQAQIYDFFWRNPHNYADPCDEPQLGFGLAFANITVHIANGWMQHKSDEHGTTCTIWLPFQA